MVKGNTSMFYYLKWKCRICVSCKLYIYKVTSYFAKSFFFLLVKQLQGLLFTQHWYKMFFNGLLGMSDFHEAWCRIGKIIRVFLWLWQILTIIFFSNVSFLNFSYFTYMFKLFPNSKFFMQCGFHWLGPLGRVSHRVAMSVCMYVTLWNTHFWVSWRPLVEELIPNIGLW